MKQRSSGLFSSENSDLPRLSEIAVAVAVDEYGTAIGSTVATGVPQEKGAYRVGTPPRDGKGHLDVDVGSDDLKAANFHQNIAVSILEDVSLSVVVKV